MKRLKDKSRETELLTFDMNFLLFTSNFLLLKGGDLYVANGSSK